MPKQPEIPGDAPKGHVVTERNEGLKEVALVTAWEVQLSQTGVVTQGEKGRGQRNIFPLIHSLNHYQKPFL